MMSKYISFHDAHGGVWNCDVNIRRGMKFREILQRAKGIEDAIGSKVQINLNEGNSIRDITEWIWRIGE